MTTETPPDTDPRVAAALVGTAAAEYRHARGALDIARGAHRVSLNVRRFVAAEAALTAACRDWLALEEGER